MSNTKHTPGPWELWNTDLVIEPLTGDNICQTFGGMDGKTIYKNAQANAKLIASAPELLDALNKILPILEAVRTSNGIALSIRYQTEYDLAKAAIQKATNS